MQLGGQKKNTVPSLKSLHPKLFKVKQFWYVNLISTVVIAAGLLIFGFYSFFEQSNKDHGADSSVQNSGDLLGATMLNTVIEQWQTRVNQPIVIARDPSQPWTDVSPIIINSINNNTETSTTANGSVVDIENSIIETEISEGESSPEPEALEAQ